MTSIHKFEELVTLYSSHSHKTTVAIVCPSDEASKYVVNRCLAENLADFIITDIEENLCEYALWQATYGSRVKVISCNDLKSSADTAVAAVKNGEAQVLMKGIINTDVLMHSVLNKESGLLPSGSVMSHATITEIPGFNRLLLFSDATVIPYPDQTQLEAMIKYDIAIARSLGSDSPKIALIHFTEKINPKFPITVAYSNIIEKFNGSNIKIAGPMDVKTAVDLHSAEVKGIVNDVVGKADILIFPDLEAGNTFYKTISGFAQATMAGIITGADAPIVLPSRADSPASKFHSLILACLTTKSE